MIDHRLVAGLFRAGDGVLLCHRRSDRRWYPDVWDLPGGHVDDGENPRRALVRELREELGVHVDVPTEGPDTVIRDRDARIELSIWLIDSWRGEIVNVAPDEHDDIRWFAAGDIASLSLAHPRYPELLRRALGDVL
ncbi:8-oxo-dGTP diphosphatase [bacterium BMS3Abin02]|nr:8-oxo-dGTP diphosphatase [bacterium BMS3Abin02]GBE22481.1 8-oxo-dGTP diphosphatase [bacterium BMS3Bbin01]HDH26277.1 NUDIX domain-containing protein [Actinomycetota bacterium]